MPELTKDLADKITAYESGEISEGEMLELFSELVKSGTIQTLQAYYRRMASLLTMCGYLDKKGGILKRF